MRKHERTLLFVILTLLLALATACRSKPVPKEEPKPAAPPPPVVAFDEPESVEAPADFVPEQPVQSEDLSGDIAAVTDRAHERGWIRDAFFALDVFSLTPEAQDNLAISAAWLKAHSELDLLIEGHCDERGTEQYNLALGDRRANTARDYLITLGVSSARIKTVSYGEERPFDPGHNESAWAKNRRAHLVLQRR